MTVHYLFHVRIDTIRVEEYTDEGGEHREEKEIDHDQVLLNSRFYSGTIKEGVTDDLELFLEDYLEGLE